MEIIRTIIVDDEPLARLGIRKQLSEQKEFEIVSECRNGLEAVEAITNQSPDLVFLDVQMPELDGFGVVEMIGVKRMPTIIFVTAYDEHAVRAFDVHALDYLLKPIDDVRLAKAVERARLQIQRHSVLKMSSQLQNLIDEIKPKGNYAKRLPVKFAGRILIINVDEIDWIQAADNYVRLFIGRESHVLRETMASLEQKLDPYQFLRVHRSIIVNVKRIKEVRPLFHSVYEIVLRNGIRLSTGRRYRTNLHMLIGQ